MFDFAYILTDREVLAAMKHTIKKDSKALFMRPFRKNLWFSIVAAAIILLLITQAFSCSYQIPGLGFKSQKKYQRIIILFCWSLFMIIEIHYEGALTMFFTTETELHFESTRDVIRAYPNWKLMMRYGTDISYLPHVESGDPDYIAFWNRVIENPDESVFQGLEQFLTEHQDHPHVIREYQAKIDVNNKYGRPELQNKLKILYKDRVQYMGILITKNSPLGPILRHGTNNMFERGVLDYLAVKWLGRGRHEDSLRDTLSSSKIVLGMDHMSLVFIGYISIFAISILFLFGEIFMKKVRRTKYTEAAATLSSDTTKSTQTNYEIHFMQKTKHLNLETKNISEIVPHYHTNIKKY